MKTLKPAEDGNGNVIHLSRPRAAAVAFEFHQKLLRIERAWVCNTAEDKRTRDSLSLGVR